MGKVNLIIKTKGFFTIFLILGLMVFLALGCSFNFGESSGDPTSTEKKSSDSADDESRKDDKDDEDEKSEKDKKDKEDDKEEVAEETKPTPPPAPKKVAPPTGATVGYCNSSNVVLRAGPSLTAKKIGGLSNRQRLYIIRYSNTYDNWKGTTANWAYIQTESGKRGWVFTPFVSY